MVLSETGAAGAGGLEAYRSGDLLSRIRADIDTLDNVYLRLLVPAAVALLATLVFTTILFWYLPMLALVEGLLLLLAGVGVPWLVNRLGNTAGRQKAEAAAQLRAALVTDVQGMGELLMYDAADRHAAHIQALSQDLAQRQRTLSGLSGVSQGALGLCANLAMWAMIVILCQWSPFKRWLHRSWPCWRCSRWQALRR